MKLTTRCIPIGKLPYDSIDVTTKMAAKLFEKMPFVAVLPNISERDTVINRTLENIPGVKHKDNKFLFKMSSSHYKQNLPKLELAFNNPQLDNLEPFAIESPFLEKYLQMIKKFKSPNAIINLMGPFTISQQIVSVDEEPLLTDKNFRKLLIQAVCVKALWVAKKVKEISPDTELIVMLEEPMFGQFGNIKRENEDVTAELVTMLFSRIVEKLKESGILVGVHCMEKCDWKIPMSAGVDMISFDAYNNPNNLCIIPEQVIEFVSRGGKINWGIVPVMTESIVKTLNIDYVTTRLLSTMEGLILSGVPEHFVYNSATVSVQGDVDKLPIIFAEKAIILATQLAKRIPSKKSAVNAEE